MVRALALPALVRFAVLLGIDGAFLVLAEITAEPGDADIGLGLLFFLVVAVVAGAWAILDGRRVGLARTVVVWLVAGVLLGIAMPILIGLLDGFDWSVVASDLAAFVPFTVALVVAPAAVGGAIGQALRRRGPAS